MTAMKWNRASPPQWTPRDFTKHEPTPDEIRRAAERRAAAKRQAAANIAPRDVSGIPCPRCNQPTEVRTHPVVTAKMKRRPYYTKWYYCKNPNCKTTTVVRDEDRSDVQERLAKITEQLKVRR